MSELQIKINNALKIMKMAEKNAELHNEPVEIAYSGGKDSDVILQLAKEAGIFFKAYYKNTTIDPPGTLQHVRENGVEVCSPKERFFSLIARKGFPSFRFRFCCQELQNFYARTYAQVLSSLKIITKIITSFQMFMNCFCSEHFFTIPPLGSCIVKKNFLKTILMRNQKLKHILM